MAYWFQLASLAMLLGFGLSGWIAATSSEPRVRRAPQPRERDAAPGVAPDAAPATSSH